MKKTIHNLILPPTGLLFWLALQFFPPQAAAQKDITTGKKIAALTAVIQKYHLQPRPVDDSLSRDVFSMFLDAADPYRAILLKADIDLLKPHRSRLDEEIKNGHSDFFDIFIPLYKLRIERAVQILDIAASQPADLNSSDTIHYGTKPLEGFPADSTAQLLLWQQYLKSTILDMMFESAEINDTIFGLSTPQLLEMEPAFRTKAHFRIQRWINNLLNSPEGLQNRMIAMYLNTITSCYDPHSNYYSPEQMKNLRSDLSGTSYLFGFDISETKAGQVCIAGIIPGSPAWKSNELNTGDVLISLRWEDSPEVDLKWASSDEVGEMLSASIDKKLLLTVLKSDGRIITVSLLKDKITSPDDRVSSYILDGEKKIGYICLPDFYTSDESNDALGCANDVAKELVKLKKEGIGGLILDLQYNGGGSVREAVDLAGIFIEAGPVCIFHRRDEKPLTLKDMNIGTAWDGPLLIMVNNYSASASEVVSAALQDYHRALVVGTPTYGKSTGQTLLPADTNLITEFNKNKNININALFGYTKVTTSRLYRINGSSHQKTGVQPDILLPDPFYDASSGEKSQTFAFVNARTDKKTYYTPLPELPVETLNRLSRERTTQNPYFKACHSLCDSLNALSITEYTVISLETARSESLDNISAVKRLENLATSTLAPYKARNNSYDEKLNQTDEYRRTASENARIRLEKDPNLMEAFQIMNDLINHLQNSK